MNLLLAEIPILQLLLPLAGTMLLSYGIYQVIAESRKGAEQRVADRLRGEQRKQKQDKKETLLRRDFLAEEAGSLLSMTVGRFSFVPKLQTMLVQADLPWSAQKLLGNLIAATILITSGLVLLKINVLVAMAVGASTIFLPLGFISFKRKRRMKKLVRQLPDVFEMMSQALRAGHSLASAIHLVHEQMADPVSTEFGRVFHEQNLGIRMEDALLAMADRVESLDVKMFVTAVLIQRTTGGDLAEVLDKIGAVIRGRIELFGLVQGLTAEGRLSGWVLFGLPFLVFAALLKLNFDYVAVLWTDSIGKILLVGAIGMELMGLAMIRWIVNIKV